MPGRVNMDQQSAVGSQDLKKDRRHAQDEGMAQKIAQVNGPSIHGRNDTLLNGVPVSNGDVLMTDGDHADSDTMFAGLENPPPLDQAWRETPANKSLGKLMDRAAQQCYFDLNETLTKMAEIGPEPDAPQANGVSAQAQQDTSETSLAKKRLLMNFAHDQRDRFTKTLVLSHWAENEEQMARLIDLKVWQDKQRFAYAEAARAIGETKRKLIDFKVPAPNIEGALELRATGTAWWVPDLGYIPPKRLTAKQLLRILKNMNVTLATRLNLHEERLPPYMQDFKIADGRATFAVPGEFEVDLSVADDEPTSRFYFIDIRFLFTPSVTSLHEQLRPHLEARTNDMLGTKGLQGCYDFLHNFVLTHKINVLRSQAQELIRYGKWFDCIKVENMRRSMIVQYWSGMPGPKNWFEIGICSGKQKPGSRKKPTPALMVKWFRKGNEVLDERLEFDWKKLDLEACLVSVIGKHCFGKLAAVKAGIQTLAPIPGVLNVEVTQTDTRPGECKLSLELPAMRSPLVVRIEHVTGQMYITPASAPTQNIERILKGDPNADVPRLLASLACQVVQEQMRKQAELLSWTEVQNMTSIRAKLGADVLQRNVFELPGWGQRWALVISFSLSGEKWWIVQLQDTRPDDRNRVLRNVSSVHQLALGDDPLDSKGMSGASYSRASLLRIEKLAVAEVSYTMLSEQLRTLRVPHSVETAPMLTAEPASSLRPSASASATVFVRFSSLMHDKRDKVWKPWAADSVRLTHHGMAKVDYQPGEAGSVRHDLRLSLEPRKLKYLQQHFKRRFDRDIAINSTGGLAVRLRTPFGESFVEQIRTRLRSVEQLDHHVAILTRLGFTCTVVGLARVAFTYNTTPQLNAQLSLTSDEKLPVKVKLEPTDCNPHSRIRVMLEQRLNQQKPDAFWILAHTLPLTLPLLQTFERLESATLQQRTFVVRCRSATWYSVAYKPPLPACTFEIWARAKRQSGKAVIKWHLRDSKAKSVGDGAKRDEAVVKALKALWQEKGEHWFGVGNGIVANAAGIATALERLDQLVRVDLAALQDRKPTQTTSTHEPAAQAPPKQVAKAGIQRPVDHSKGPSGTSQSPPDVIMLD
ncbi:hypothetical protein LTR08_005569 [Meristemomyces frigidus]|nr:hypothetical protein LTR08_005569 [Meristemomyces frigidus]